MIRFLKKFLLAIVIFLALTAGLIYLSGKTHLFTALTYWFADVDDYKIFKNNTVTTDIPQPWQLSDRYNQVETPDTLTQQLDLLRTNALVVIQNDQILYEKYWNGYNDSSYSGSFSVAKSIVSILIGTAIQDGLIESVNDPVGKYLPEWSQGDRSKLTIKDLLTMTSGTDWSESYSSPLSITTEAYYGTDLEATMAKLNIVEEPGSKFIYKSGDTQILGFILSKVTGKSLAALTSEKLWKPLGASFPALWSIDQQGGHEKAYCCFNTNARDFARIGQLMLDSGEWKGNRIIPKEYFMESVTPHMIQDENQKACDYYGYQWWIYAKYPGIFYARGILGQFIIVMPEQDMVIVRLGEKYGEVSSYETPDLVQSLVEWGRNL